MSVQTFQRGVEWVEITSTHSTPLYILFICMYVCMYVCMYIYIYSKIHVYIHTYIHVCIHTCIHCLAVFGFVLGELCSAASGVFGGRSRATRMQVCVYEYNIKLFVCLCIYIYDGIKLCVCLSTAVFGDGFTAVLGSVRHRTSVSLVPSSRARVCVPRTAHK